MEAEKDQAQGDTAGNEQTGFGLWALHLETAMACPVACGIPFRPLPGSIYPLIPCLVHTGVEDPLNKDPR